MKMTEAKKDIGTPRGEGSETGLLFSLCVCVCVCVCVCARETGWLYNVCFSWVGRRQDWCAEQLQMK